MDGVTDVLSIAVIQNYVDRARGIAYGFMA